MLLCMGCVCNIFGLNCGGSVFCLVLLLIMATTVMMSIKVSNADVHDVLGFGWLCPFTNFSISFEYVRNFVNA